MLKEKVNKLKRQLEQQEAAKKNMPMKSSSKLPLPNSHIHEYGRGDCVCNFSPFSTSELTKICRKILATGIFTLTMPELKIIHNATYIAALEKDPLKKMTTMLSLDLNDSKCRVAYLEDQLAESTKQLKLLSRTRSQDINITINTPITCTQTQMTNNAFGVLNHS